MAPGATAQASETADRELSELAEAARGGDRGNVEALLHRVRLVAHRYSRARLAGYPGGYQLADDVAQDICLAVLRALPRYQDRGRPFEAFVHGVASRKVADAQRAAMRHPVPTDELPDEVDAGPTPEDHAVLNSDAETAAELLQRLPKSLREVMLLRVGAGLSAKETAAALAMSPGAVRVAQHRALGKMREMAGVSCGGAS
ncbi:MAG: RNA polymerase sigma factor ShbA [Nocardioidaceae bacterium]